MIEGHWTKVISPTQGNARYRRIALIYNPFAGGLRGRKASRLSDAQEVFRQYGAEVDPIPTDGPRTAGILAARAVSDGADLIIAAGGDGTINEVAEGMIGSAIPLGILPAGTANVLACEMHLPLNMPRAAAALLRYPAERVSVGRLHNGAEKPRHFLLMAGAGLDARIVYSLNSALKRRTGKLAYWLAGLSQFGRTVEEFSVQVNAVVYRCGFALIAKVRNYGGDLEIAREVSLLDDQFEVVLFHGRESWRYAGYFAAVAARQIRRLKGVTVLRAREVELICAPDDRIHLQVDGELAGVLPARAEIVPAALTLLVNPEYTASRSSYRAGLQGHREADARIV